MISVSLSLSLFTEIRNYQYALTCRVPRPEKKVTFQILQTDQNGGSESVIFMAAFCIHVSTFPILFKANISCTSTTTESRAKIWYQ